MTFTAPVKPSFKRELIPEDSYQAVCYSLYDLGTHESEWKGQKRNRHLVMLTWEIPALRIEYGKDDEKLEGPKVISKKYTWSMNENADLRKDMESWRGKGFTELEAQDFDFETLLGANCMLQILHKKPEGGEPYAYIASITKIAKGQEKLIPENPKTFFTFRPPFVDAAGVHWPETMPEWVRNIVKESHEYSMTLDTPLEDDPIVMDADEEKIVNGLEKNESDDIPF
jgi:hypothetical protein